MSAKPKTPRHSGESRNPVPLEVREGPITPYLAKPQQPRRSRESGNPVLYRRAPLGDLIRPRREKAQPPACPDLPYIGMEHVESHTMRLLGTVPAATMKSMANRFYAGDVLYGRLRPYLNKVYRADFDGLCSAEFIVLPKTEGVDPDFLRYRLNSRDFVSFTTHLNAGDRPRVDFDQISPFEIEVPEPNDQRRIVAKLETHLTRLDASVTALKRVQANLKRYRASVLKAACEGRLVPTEIDANKWSRATLGDTARVVGGLTKNPRRAALPMRIPYLRVANVYANELRLDEVEQIGVAESELYKLLLVTGDLLIVEGNGSKDQIGRLALWDGSIDPCVHQNHLIKVRLTGPATPKWILFWLLSPQGRRHIEEVSSSTSGLYTLSVGKVAALPVVLPSLADQQHIIDEVERRLSVIEELEATVAANLRRGERLRAAVLSAAFSDERAS